MRRTYTIQEIVWELMLPCGIHIGCWRDGTGRGIIQVAKGKTKAATLTGSSHVRGAEGPGDTSQPSLAAGMKTFHGHFGTTSWQGARV